MTRRVRYGEKKEGRGGPFIEGVNKTGAVDGQKRMTPSGDELDWDDGVLGLNRSMMGRIIALQVTANIALLVLFYLNWSMKPSAFEVRANTGMLSYPIWAVTVIGFVTSAIVCMSTYIWDKLMKHWSRIFLFEYTRPRGLLILIIIIAIVVILMGPEDFLALLVQLFISFFYLATLLFGMYGIWQMRGTHIITSGMFTFFTALSVQRTNLPLPEVLVFALCFLLFMELSSSAIRQYALASEELVPVRFQSRMVDRYLLYLGLFTALALGLTFLSLRARLLLNLVSPAWSVESIEVQGFLGLVLPAVGTLLFVVIARYLWNWRAEGMLGRQRDKRVMEGRSPYAVARALLRNEG